MTVEDRVQKAGLTADAKSSNTWGNVGAMNSNITKVGVVKISRTVTSVVMMSISTGTIVVRPRIKRTTNGHESTLHLLRRALAETGLVEPMERRTALLLCTIDHAIRLAPVGRLVLVPWISIVVAYKPTKAYPRGNKIQTMGVLMPLQDPKSLQVLVEAQVDEVAAM